jgi:hypothetical protein
MCILLWCASLAFARYSRFSYQQVMHKSCGPPRSRISEAFGFRSVSAAAETRLDLDTDGRGATTGLDPVVIACSFRALAIC